MMLIKKLFTLFSVGLLSLPASAVTLSDLYFLAIKHDPTFNAAVKEQVAGKEYRTRNRRSPGALCATGA